MRETPPLTRKQKKVLTFIQEYLERHEIAPSLEEIARHFAYQSLNSAQQYVEVLTEKGYLQRGSANQKRSLNLHRNFLNRVEGRLLPMLGYVAAGQPIEAIEQQENIEIPSGMLKKAGKHFVLQVQGESMRDEG